jgi:hypothetical protein
MNMNTDSSDSHLRTSRSWRYLPVSFGSNAMLACRPGGISTCSISSSPQVRRLAVRLRKRLTDRVRDPRRRAQEQIYF